MLRLAPHVSWGGGKHSESWPRSTAASFVRGSGRATAHARATASHCWRRGLTLRSRRGPTALHQAREAPRHIMRLAGLAQHRWSRLNSNVRPREIRRAVLQQNQRLSAWTEQPRRGGSAGDRAPYYSTRYGRSVQRDRKAPRQKARGRNNAAPGCESDDWEPPCYIGTPRCVGGHRLQSVRWVASGTGASADSQGSRRLECWPRHRRRRGVGRRRGGAPETTKASQVQAVARRARPNPSSEARPNGIAPGPRGTKAYHVLRGPGAMPLVPPQLER